MSSWMRLWRASASVSSSAQSSSRPGDLGGGLDGPAVLEDRHDLQQRPLGVVEQADAPVDRGPQGALPIGQVDRAGPQRVQRGFQAAQDRVGVQQAGAGGG